MARATASWGNTEQTHWEPGDLIRDDYWLAEVLQNIEHIAQTHEHREDVANDGGPLILDSVGEIWFR